MSNARLPVSALYNYTFSKEDLPVHVLKRYTLLAALAQTSMVSVTELRAITQMGNGTFYRHLHGLHTDFGIRTRASEIDGERHIALDSWGIIDKVEFLKYCSDLVRL